MSKIEGSILQPSATGAPTVNRLFTALGALVYAAAALIIVAAILVEPPAAYQPREVTALSAPIVNSGLDLLNGLPLPRF